jgi:hypothetical protein
MNLANVNQDSLGQEGLDRFEDLEHIIGHFTSELDALETELEARNKERPGLDPLSAAEAGFLFVHLKDWREDAARIVEYAEACEQHIVQNFHRQGEETGNGFYTRRASFYAEQAEHLRDLAGHRA